MDTGRLQCAAAMSAKGPAMADMNCCCSMSFGHHQSHRKSSIVGLAVHHRLHLHPLPGTRRRRNGIERHAALLVQARLLDEMAVLAAATVLPLCWIYLRRLYSTVSPSPASNSSSTLTSQNEFTGKGHFSSPDDEFRSIDNSSCDEISTYVILDCAELSGLQTDMAVSTSNTNGQITKVVTDDKEFFTPDTFFDSKTVHEEKERLDALLLHEHNTLKNSSLSEEAGTITQDNSSIIVNGKLNGPQNPTTQSASREESALKHFSKNEPHYLVTQNGSVSALSTDLEGSAKQQGCYDSELVTKQKGPYNGDLVTKQQGYYNNKLVTKQKGHNGDLVTENHQRFGNLSANKDGTPRRHLSAYKQLLNHGRLQDCVRLLEQMNDACILDTNRIYHSKFFLTCKRQKAVNEAFKFLKLIVKPSLTTYNLVLSVCAAAGDVDGAFQAFSSLKQAGLQADCMLYTTLISTCAKAGKIDLLFKIFHEMVNAGIEPNIYTYGALIDGCACAGEVAKAFGVYGIMRLKKVKPDRVVFNSLITACGRSGALERAFDVLSEMKAEPIPVQPDYVTIGALIKACNQAKKFDQALEVYKMMKVEGIRGSIEVYTEAVHACWRTADLDTAFGIYNDLKKEKLQPDEVFFSAIIDVAGHAKQIDVAFEMLDEMKQARVLPGSITYGALMGACCKTESWEKALDLYRDMQKKDLLPSVSTFNALMTALCGAEKLQESVQILQDMRHAGKAPNQITYTILLDACERLHDIDLAFKLYEQSMSEGVAPTIGMCESIAGLCLRKIQFFSSSIVSSSIGRKLYEKWILWALSVYQQTVKVGVVPTTRLFSRLFGCLRLPVSSYTKYLSALDHYNVDEPIPLLDGFGIYDPRALTLFEEAAKFDAVPSFSFSHMDGPFIVDSELMPVHVAEVCLLKLLKSLKYRHAAGARLSPIIVHLSIEKKTVILPNKGEKIIAVASSTGRAIEALLRRLKLPFYGHGSSGKIRITGAAIQRWLCPTEGFDLPLQYHDSGVLTGSLSRGIAKQQQLIRSAEARQWSPNLDISRSYQHDVLDQQMQIQSHSPSHKPLRRKKRQDALLNDKVLMLNDMLKDKTAKRKQL